MATKYVERNARGMILEVCEEQQQNPRAVLEDSNEHPDLAAILAVRDSAEAKEARYKHLLQRLLAKLDTDETIIDRLS